MEQNPNTSMIELPKPHCKAASGHQGLDRGIPDPWLPSIPGYEKNPNSKVEVALYIANHIAPFASRHLSGAPSATPGVCQHRDKREPKS